MDLPTKILSSICGVLFVAVVVAQIIIALGG